MQPASWLVLHPSDDEPLAPVTLSQALVVFLVEVERRHRFQILCSQPRRQRWRCVGAAEDLVEPASTETRKSRGMPHAIRQIGVSEVTYYRWRQEFGGLKIEQVKRLKELELENSGEGIDLLGIWRGASFAVIRQTGFGEPSKGAPHGNASQRTREELTAFAGQAHSSRGCPGKLLPYSEHIVRAPFLQIYNVRDHTARLLLLSEVSTLLPHDGIRRNGRSHLSHAVVQAMRGLVIACPFRKLLVEFRNATVQLVPLRPHVLDQHAHSLAESFNLRAHFRELSFEFASALRNYDAAFKQYGPQLIDQRRPFPYQSITRPMQGLHVKLLLAL